MNLPVLPDPWYSAGLKFTCTQCGNCCTGGPGFVWITDEEIALLAEHLKITPRETIAKFCRKIGGKLSLNESRNPEHGGYDCVFLKQDKTGKRGCSIYPVRPLQCRTWPFWDGNLATPHRWEHSAKKCPGMNHGEHFELGRIEALRKAKEWPRNAPTSRETK